MKKGFTFRCIYNKLILSTSCDPLTTEGKDGAASEPHCQEQDSCRQMVQGMVFALFFPPFFYLFIFHGFLLIICFCVICIRISSYLVLFVSRDFYWKLMESPHPLLIWVLFFLSPKSVEVFTQLVFFGKEPIWVFLRKLCWSDSFSTHINYQLLGVLGHVTTVPL